jgi:hypothetical protein
MKEKLEQEIRELKNECEKIRKDLKEKFKDLNTFEFLHEMKKKGYEYKVHSVEFVDTYADDADEKAIGFIITFEDNGRLHIYIQTK